MTEPDEDDEIDRINADYGEIFEDIKIFDELISDLPAAISSPIKAQFGKIMGGLSSCHMKLAMAARSKIASLGSDCNYLLFDLEATRRERDEFKKRLGL